MTHLHASSRAEQKCQRDLSSVTRRTARACPQHSRAASMPQNELPVLVLVIADDFGSGQQAAKRRVDDRAVHNDICLHEYRPNSASCWIRLETSSFSQTIAFSSCRSGSANVCSQDLTLSYGHSRKASRELQNDPCR